MNKLFPDRMERNIYVARPSVMRTLAIAAAIVFVFSFRAAAAAAATDAAAADTVLFKSGKSIQGAITECSDTHIKLGVAGVSLTYYIEDIASINGMPPTEAIAQLTGSSPAHKDALGDWERRYGITAKDYWEAHCAFEKARSDYEGSIHKLIGKYFSSNIQSLEDIHEKNITLPQGFVDEFKLIKHPPTRLAEKFKIPPPPGKLRQGCMEREK
jgi:hypothetical protein